jgi:hypothetical protein
MLFCLFVLLKIGRDSSPALGTYWLRLANFLICWTFIIQSIVDELLWLIYHSVAIFLNILWVFYIYMWQNVVFEINKTLSNEGFSSCPFHADFENVLNVIPSWKIVRDIAITVNCLQINSQTQIDIYFLFLY